MKRIWGFGMAAVLTAGALSGSVLVSASAEGGPAGYQVVSAQSSQFGGASFLSAEARSNHPLVAGTGALRTCVQGCGDPQGIGRAEANGETGRLRASGGSYFGGPFAGAGEAVIFDTITFLGPTATIEVDIDGSVFATDVDEAFGEMEFRIFTPDSGGLEDSSGSDYFRVLAYEQAGIRRHQVGGAEWIDGIPSRFRYTVQLPVFPGSTSSTFTLGFALSAAGQCLLPQCEAYASFENTAYLKIDGQYTSENGYVYAGRDDGDTVPEPAARWMAGPAVVLLGFAARRRRRYAKG